MHRLIIKFAKRIISTRETYGATYKHKNMLHSRRDKDATFFSRQVMLFTTWKKKTGLTRTICQTKAVVPRATCASNPRSIVCFLSTLERVLALFPTNWI